MRPRIFRPRPQLVSVCVTAYGRKRSARRPRTPQLGTIWAQTFVPSYLPPLPRACSLSLHLLQPEARVHLPELRHCTCEMFLGLLDFGHSPVKPGEAEVAAGTERPHPGVGGQRGETSGAARRSAKARCERAPSVSLCPPRTRMEAGATMGTRRAFSRAAAATTVAELRAEPPSGGLTLSPGTRRLVCHDQGTRGRRIPLLSDHDLPTPEFWDQRGHSDKDTAAGVQATRRIPSSPL